MHAHAVKLQLCALLLVTGIMVFFELLIYLYGVVPFAQRGLRSMIEDGQRSNAEGPTNAVRSIDSVLAVGEERERPLVAANNSRSVLYGLIITVVPLLIVVMLFLGHARMRTEAKLDGVLRDVVLSVSLILMFQISFFVMGQQWVYPSMKTIVHAVTQDYRTAAVAMDRGAEPAIVPEIRALWRGAA